MLFCGLDKRPKINNYLYHIIFFIKGLWCWICDISRNLQVICITHLAQIASFGDCNYKIEKFDEDNQTVTQVKLLNSDEKVVEIARMLGNASNNISINLAKEIIDESQAYKHKLS